ncbi:MAG: hypothetical protein KAX38_09500, partial [Candidatus Krumholzibacteria bacterium]|nr:hypothetical protein [Candidatus Krumholzibacteria bacterium]
GFETRKGLLLREGERPSLVLSFLDESRITRMRATARLDGLGGRNDFSFLAEGGMNFGESWTVQSVLYFFGSAERLYNLGFEFRPGRRFLFMLAFGSFIPFQEDIMLNYSHDLHPPEKERRVSIFTRIWFGNFRGS